MTSSVSATNQDGEHVDVKESSTVTTIHKIYREDNENIIFRDPNSRRSFINRPAYAKLHRSYSSGSKRHSVDNLKGRFENLARQSSQEQNQNDSKQEKSQVDSVPFETKTEEKIAPIPIKPGAKPIKPREEPTSPIEEFTPASFGYPKTAKLAPPLLKPKPVIKKRTPKDENSNVVARTPESSDAEEIRIVLQPSASQDSVDKIAKELSNFTMDGKPKERKRVGSFKKLFGLFGKDKKKKEDERRQKSGDNIVYNDNLKNESSFNRQSPLRQTVPNAITSDERRHNQKLEEIREQTSQSDRYNERLDDIIMQEAHERRVRELEEQYAQLHVNRFNSIRQSFNDEKTDNYVILDNTKTKRSINDYVSTPVNKYIDTSSSASVESEKPNGVITRDTPPRAQETYQNIQVVKPRAAIPIIRAAIPVSSERPLPNPYQVEKDSPRTIERNLNRSNSKDFPDKPSFPAREVKDTGKPAISPKIDEMYGTVFDSLDYAASRNGDIKTVNSRPPQSPSKLISLESTKLKLPPNREIYEPLPRVRSPIPTNKVSTEKIIATELLKNTRSPTPPKRVSSISSKPVDAVVAKPPISPKSLKVQEPQFDRIVTNALVHAPKRSETAAENKPYVNVVPKLRSSTPVDLRMTVSMKMSPKKEDVRKSVEEYYWKQLKKLKEEEDSRLYTLQMNGYYEEQSRLKRSRSLSPHRAGRRSLSLPRDGRGPNYVDYGRVPPPQPIPEDQALTTDGRITRRFVYDQNFVRNNPERRSVDSLQRPIFRRGSLTKQEVYETTPYNKRVSFGNQAAQLVWPTRNGYTQNPPQRRLDRTDSDLDDEVFVQSPADPIYGNRWVQSEPMYTNRVLEQFRAAQYDNTHPQQFYGQVPAQMGDRRLSMDSLPRQQEIYVPRSQPMRRPVSNIPQFDEYGRISGQRYLSNSQLPIQHNSELPIQRSPVYSSRQSITDSNYGQKQITVRNKFCDMYGQIHDSPRSGTLMGQLQNPPMGRLQNPPMIPPRQPDSFVRGSRLTASANDIGKRYVDQKTNNEKFSSNYDNRPLPPPPRQVFRNAQISDTESGSDASEIQRIMQNKTKRRGLFGK